jgi:glutamate:GABA antiporter
VDVLMTALRTSAGIPSVAGHESSEEPVVDWVAVVAYAHGLGSRSFLRKEMMVTEGVPPVEHTTVLAVEEKAKLIPSLRRFDMVFFTVCAFVGLDTLGTVASNGAQGFTWLAVLSVLFVLPYALVMAEVGSAFTQEGGPYEWTKLAFGRVHAAIAAVLYWITNPLWVGGSLAFIATDSWRANVFSIGHGTFGDYLFKGIFIWLSIGVAIVSLRHGKWIPNFGALLRIMVMGFFTLTVIIYALKHGVHGFAASDLSPTAAVFLALVPLLLFNYVGFELQNGAAEEMDAPQRDVPISIIRSGVLGVLLYTIPVFSIILVLPPRAITGIGGFIDAVTTTFNGVYGGAAHTLLLLMTLCFVGTLITSGAVWMIGSDRIQAVAAYDGGFPGFFGVFSRRLGTPVRVNVLSGLVSMAFMVVAIAAFDSGSDSTFQVVLDIAISTTLISYLWIFPAAVRLRFSHRLVPRPYRVPFGDWGIRIAGGLTTLWVALGSWVAVFPGTLEKLFGLGYDFRDEWGVSRARFEAITLGTLAVILAIALIGYALGRPVRERQLDLPLTGPPSAGEAAGQSP